MMNATNNFSLTIFLTLFLLPSICFSQIQWAKDTETALDLAQQTNKPVLLYLFTPQAENCIKYQNETFRSVLVTTYLNDNFYSVPVNADSNRSIATKYGVVRVPTVLILTPKGDEITRLVTFYPAERLIESLDGIDYKASMAALQESSTKKKETAIYQESFESLYGWGNEGSQEGCTVQFSLVKGLVGRAFKVQYTLQKDTWNYVQFFKEFDYFDLPEDFTIVMQIAGTGGRNNLDLKFIDTDYGNYGAILKIPTDFKAHQYVITSKELKYLWGGTNETMDTIKALHIGITPNQEVWGGSGAEPEGEVYLDELYILPGLHPEITRSKTDYILTR